MKAGKRNAYYIDSEVGSTPPLTRGVQQKATVIPTTLHLKMKMATTTTTNINNCNHINLD
jgi:hypothetical protein